MGGRSRCPRSVERGGADESVSTKGDMVRQRERAYLASRVEGGGQESAVGEGAEPDGDGGDGQGVIRESGIRGRRVHRGGIEQPTCVAPIRTGQLGSVMALVHAQTHLPTFHTLTPASSEPLMSAASSWENSRTETAR